MSDYGGNDADDRGADFGEGEENDENLIEEEQYVEDYDADAQMADADGAAGDGAPTTNGHAPDSTDYQQNVVVGGDGGPKPEDLNTVRGVKNKRIPGEKRTTTPYMTKYERARVLGTRALQIR